MGNQHFAEEGQQRQASYLCDTVLWKIIFSIFLYAVYVIISNEVKSLYNKNGEHKQDSNNRVILSADTLSHLFCFTAMIGVSSSFNSGQSHASSLSPHCGIRESLV